MGQGNQRDALHWGGEYVFIGEALNRLAKFAPRIVSRVSESELFIGFRNILIRGCADVNDRAVWFVIETDLTTLSLEADALMEEA